MEEQLMKEALGLVPKQRRNTGKTLEKHELAEACARYAQKSHKIVVHEPHEVLISHHIPTRLQTEEPSRETLLISREWQGSALHQHHHTHH